MNVMTQERRALRDSLLNQLGGVAMCQAIGLHYVDDASALTAEIAWHDGLSTRDGSGQVHRGALLALADNLLGANVPIERGYRAAQATISLRADWLAPAPVGSAIRCTAEESILTRGATFIRARIRSMANPQTTVGIITAQFIEGANPGGSDHDHLFEGDPPAEPFAALADFDSFLGLQEDGEGGYVVPPHSRLIGHPFVPALHGGIVAAILDDAAWRTVKPLGATRVITSNTTFLRPVAGNRTVRLNVEIVRKGRSLIVARPIAWQDSPDRPAAIGELVALTIEQD